jgi:DNA-binding MarR family transcriptional regulator
MVTTGVEVEDKRVVDVAARLRVAIFRTARRLRQEAGADLGSALIAALGTIERHGPLTPSELADLERVQRPTATRMVIRLEGEGLIVRARDPADGRSSLVSASARGRELLRRLRKRRTAYLARRLRELDPNEVAALGRAADILEHLLEGERR